jgi:hypothetical protein
MGEEVSARELVKPGQADFSSRLKQRSLPGFEGWIEQALNNHLLRTFFH